MAESLLKILPYGSCSAHDPVYNLGKRGLAFPVWYRIRARETLYAHTIGEFIQLTEFLRGDLTIDRAIRRFICIDYDFEPSPEVRTTIEEPDTLLMEICTSESIRFERWFIHRNQMPRLFMKPMLDSQLLPDDVKKAITAWWSGLTNRKEEQQIEAAKIVALHLPPEVDDDVTRALLFEARLVPDSLRDLLSGVDRFLKMQRCKSAIIMVHYRRFMPDGRAISWPPQFRDHLFNVARYFKIPVFDPASMIADHGVATAIAPDQMHYTPTFVPIVADALRRIAVDGASAIKG